MEQRQIEVQYFAAMREQRGLGKEVVLTQAATPAELYASLSAEHGLGLPLHLVRFAVNGAFVDATTPLANGDELCLIPPVAGG